MWRLVAFLPPNEPHQRRDQQLSNFGADIQWLATPEGVRNAEANTLGQFNRPAHPGGGFSSSRAESGRSCLRSPARQWGYQGAPRRGQENLKYRFRSTASAASSRGLVDIDRPQQSTNDWSVFSPPYLKFSSGPRRQYAILHNKLRA